MDITEKLKYHLSPLRQPSRDEFNQFMKLIHERPELRIKRWDIVNGMAFLYYCNSVRGGLRLTTIDLAESVRAKTKERSRKYLNGLSQEKRDEIKARNKIALKKWVKKNPHKIRGYSLKHNLKESRIISALLRKKLRYGIIKRVDKGKSEYKDAIDFMVWAKAKIPSKEMNEYEIDHLVPMSKFDVLNNEVWIKINSPENVRWLKKLENMEKHSKMPSEEEISNHLKLVNEWKVSKGLTADTLQQ